MEDPTPTAEFLHWLAGSCGHPLTALDVGCGTGHLLRHLADFGWEVRGMEPHPAFARSAREYAPVEQAGFAELDADAAYDLIAAVNGPLSYLLTVPDRLDALRRAFRALRPGGILLIDVWNLMWMLRYYAPPLTLTHTLDGGTITLERAHTLDYHTATLTQAETYRTPDGREWHLEHRIALLTVPELAYLFGAAGFTGLQTFNGYGARHPERIEGQRIIMTGVKP